MQSQPANLTTQEQKTQNTPFYVYIFKHLGEIFHLGEVDQDVVIVGMPESKGADPQTFLRAQVQHTLGEQTVESIPMDATLQIAIDENAESAELRKYFISAPPKRITVQIVRINAEDYSGSINWSDCYTVFYGQTSNISFADEVAALTCRSFFANLNRKIPRFFYQKTCQHALYGEGCNVNGSNPKERSAITTTVLDIDRINRTITVDLLPTDPTIFEGGWFTDDYGDTIAVMASETVADTGTKLYLHWWSSKLKVGDAVTLYRGCKRIVGVGGCADFQNLQNFGGTPYIPSNNIAVDGIST